MKRRNRARILKYYYGAVAGLMLVTTAFAGVEFAKNSPEKTAEQEPIHITGSTGAEIASVSGDSSSETEKTVPDTAPAPDTSAPEDTAPPPDTSSETADTAGDDTSSAPEGSVIGTPADPAPDEQGGEDSQKPDEEPPASETPASEPPATEPPPETQPSETPPPETQPTPPPETQPPATQPPETQPPATQPPVQGGGTVQAVSQDVINDIRSRYDVTPRGYGGTSYYRIAVSEQAKINELGAAARVLLDNGTQKNVALTFQEGWENGYTMQLLDILAQYGVKASFYVTHEYAAMHQDIVQRMIREGHLVGSHTYLCPSIGIAAYNLEDIMSDALQMQQFMRATFGYEMTSYNYNAGTWSPASAVMLTRMGYSTIALCSCSYVDYEAAAAIDANATLASMQAGLIPGTIYAFHVTNPATVTFMPGLITYCLSQGYTFTTVH